MKLTEHVSDRSRIEGVDTTVDIEVEQVSGPSSDALEVLERVETAVKEEIREIAAEEE